VAGELDRIPDGISRIVHCAARVSWLAGYDELRGPNVLGTLAVLGAGVPVTHVSTISVAPLGGDEDTLLALDQARAATPYALSKWVAEQHARRAGATIHRPGMIAPHSTRGAGNPDDFICRYLAGCVALGLYIDREDAVLDLTPVDFVAEAIAALPDGATHHLVNVDRSMTYAAIGRALARAGARVTPASYPAFRAALAHTPSRLRPLLAFFPAELALGMGPWPCARTLAALAPLGITRPTVDDAYVARAVRALGILG
jgi:thioester reductase-like protein